MLYDILPPIFLFSSLGGIILTVSRITLRVRRQQFPDSRPAQPQDITVDEDQIFKPEKRGISIFKNRLAYVPHLVRQTKNQSTSFLKDKKAAMGSIKIGRRRHQEQDEKAQEGDDYPAGAISPVTAVQPSDDASQEQNITMPRSAWRERINSVTKVKGLGATLLTKAQNVRPRRGRKSALPQEGEGDSDSTTLTEETLATATEELSSDKPQPAHRITLRRTRTPIDEKPSKASKATVISRLRGSAASKPTGKTILDQASEAIASAKYNRAEDILLPYIIKHARDAQAYMLLGQTALGQRDWSEAIEIFQQVLKINPVEPGAHAALGYAALKAGRFTLALQTLQRAHEQDPQDLEVLKQLLRIAQRMDNSVLKRSVSEKITALHSSGQYH